MKRGIVSGVRFDARPDLGDAGTWVDIPIPSRVRQGDLLMMIGPGWAAAAVVTDPSAGHVRAVKESCSQWTGPQVVVGCWIGEVETCETPS